MLLMARSMYEKIRGGDSPSPLVNKVMSIGKKKLSAGEQLAQTEYNVAKDIVIRDYVVNKSSSANPVERAKRAINIRKNYTMSSFGYTKRATPLTKTQTFATFVPFSRRIAASQNKKSPLARQKFTSDLPFLDAQKASGEFLEGQKYLKYRGYKNKKDSPGYIKKP